MAIVGRAQTSALRLNSAAKKSSARMNAIPPNTQPLKPLVALRARNTTKAMTAARQPHTNRCPASSNDWCQALGIVPLRTRGPVMVMSYPQCGHHTAPGATSSVQRVHANCLVRKRLASASPAATSGLWGIHSGRRACMSKCSNFRLNVSPKDMPVGAHNLPKNRGVACRRCSKTTIGYILGAPTVNRDNAEV
jgi:hypothetical protein